jgi:poly(beta-D-mannuronate) lyase
MILSNKRFYACIALGLIVSVGAWDAQASTSILFSLPERHKELKDPDYAFARQACLSVGEGVSVETIPEPIDALQETEGYGSDNRAEEFSLFVMTEGGRALAGDPQAKDSLIKALLMWSKANALAKSKESHDTYYAIKRVLLPTIVNYAIVMEDMTDAQRAQVDAWLEPLVMRIGKHFGGDVDVNNHRLLADSVQMAWGVLKDNKELYQQGIARYQTAIKDMREDGTLPLETRRGARAVWYMRHALTSLVVMAEIARTSGDDLYDVSQDKRSLHTMVNAFLDAVESPIFILPYAAENYIPGPSDDYFTQDDGFLKKRPNQRHYMAFAEAYISHDADAFAQQRMIRLLSRTAFKERPLLDDYAGGNTTCFFWQPETKKVMP